MTSLFPELSPERELPDWLETFIGPELDQAIAAGELPAWRERLERILGGQYERIEAYGRGLDECGERARKLEAVR